MDIENLQEWLNNHGAYPRLKVDGIAGNKTKQAILQVFTNINPKQITQEELLFIAKDLGDTNTKRINAVAKVESNGKGWDESGLVKILYERHLFYKYTNKIIKWLSFGFISDKSAGGYTPDINGNKINDSWEKLIAAMCVNPDAACQSISIGKFQVLGKWYKQCGYSNPIDMLYAATKDEYSHYKMLRDYILNVAMLKKAFLKISSKKEDCQPFAYGYNGEMYKKYKYDEKIAKAYSLEK